MVLFIMLAIFAMQCIDYRQTEHIGFELSQYIGN